MGEGARPLVLSITPTSPCAAWQEDEEDALSSGFVLLLANRPAESPSTVSYTQERLQMWFTAVLNPHTSLLSRGQQSAEFKLCGRANKVMTRQRNPGQRHRVGHVLGDT